MLVIPKRYTIGFMMLFFIWLTFSCKKMIEIGPPKTELVTETVFEDPEMATAAIISIYSKLVDHNVTYELPLHTGLYSDELKNYSSDIYFAIPFYTNALLGGGNIFPPYWSRFYQYIYQANAVLEGCKNSLSLNDQVKKQLTGEAKFIRAYCYFYLANLYGDVALVTNTDYTVNSKIARTPSQQAYSQIIADLIEAEGNLNDNYVDKTSVSTIDERVRPNKYAAMALLARVYLYTKDYAGAEAATTAVIDNSALYDTVPLGNVFLKNNREAIWQIPPPDNFTWFNTPEGREFILDARPGNCTLSDQLLAAFEPSDKRKEQWTNTYVEDADTFVYPFKYKVKFSSDIIEYETVLRLAEQYLIRAEARIQQDKLIEGVSDLNVIRNRAGLQSITPTNKETLLGAILHERQVELFTEWGHRWLDLKRTEKADSVMNSIAPLKGGTWASYKTYWPIPLQDITNNPNLKQTTGY